MNLKAAGFFILALLLFATPAFASDNGIAMPGKPAHETGFDHLDYVNPDAPKGGELRLGQAGSFDSLNNHIIIGSPVEGLVKLNDRLLERVWNEPFTMYGLVAESVDMAPDRSWITFHLNPKARFHDGVPMTADDVKFSFEKLKEFGAPVRRRVFGLVKEVKIFNDHEIKFTFGEGYDRECVLILAYMPVLPKHYWEKIDFSKTTLKPPLGSGPYKIASVDPGRKIIYERVKDYWAKDLPVNKGLYNFDTISYTYFRDDYIALQAFMSGDQNLRREYNITQWLTQYKSDGIADGKIIKEEISNQRPELLKAMVFNTRRKIFFDRRVREAFSEIFNADWLNKTIYFNRMKKTDSAFANSELAASGKPQGEELRILDQYKNDLPPEVFGEAYSPVTKGDREAKRKAIQLLKDAGWKFENEVFLDASGHKASIEILLGDPTDLKVVLEFTRSLASIGIEAHVRRVDSSEFTGRLMHYDYDMVLNKWINTLSPGNEQMNYWGSKSGHIDGGRNYAGINNPAIDALADSIGRSETREMLVARVHALDRALMYGYYMIPLFYLGKDLVAYDSSIHRPSVTPLYGMVLESWWQEAANKKQ